jgi:methyltransferase (TIGR00027 family)
MEHERPDALFKDPLARVFAGETAYTKWKQDMMLHNQTEPHARSHIAIRTRVLDDIMTESLKGLNTNVVQVVSLGAGMCTRPWRLHAPSVDVIWFDVDHPDSMRLKAEIAQKQTILPSVLAYHIIGLDFSAPDCSLSLALKQNGFRQDVFTIFIMEGLLYYLELKDVGNICHEIDELVGPKTSTQVLMTVINDGFYNELKSPDSETLQKFPCTGEVGKLINSCWEGGIQSAFEGAGFSLISARARKSMQLA